MEIFEESADATKLLLTVNEAASMLGLGRTILYRLVLRGDITSLKIGRSRRVPVWSLREYVEQQLIAQGKVA